MVLKIFARLLGKPHNAEAPQEAAKLNPAPDHTPQAPPFAPPHESRAARRARENRFIKARFAEWQQAWHAGFDADPGQATADNAAKVERIPDDIDTDYRLIFGLSEVTKETRAACFAHLPKGAEVAARFEAFLSATYDRLSREQALALAADLGAAIDGVPTDVPISFERIEFADDLEDAGAELGLEGEVRHVFERDPDAPPSDAALTEKAAGLFLTEPLYAQAGNWYQPGNWITGVYRSEGQDACLEIAYRLWLGGWRLEVGEYGAALFER